MLMNRNIKQELYTPVGIPIKSWDVISEMPANWFQTSYGKEKEKENEGMERWLSS